MSSSLSLSDWLACRGSRLQGIPSASGILQGPTVGAEMQSWLGPGGRMPAEAPVQAADSSLGLAWLAVIMEEGDGRGQCSRSW